MIRSSERLLASAVSPQTESTGAYEATPADYAAAREICAEREHALASLRDTLDATLYGAIEQKLRYERAALIEYAEHDARTAHAAKARASLLEPDYFLKKSFQIDLL